jgi:hypothetical protein
MDEEEKKAKEDASDSFFEMVGRSISAWTSTEGGLVALTGLLLGVNFQKAGLILYSIPSFYTWLSIIDDLFALEEKRFGTFKPEWGQIAERLKKLNEIRVRLAHHTSPREEEIEGFPVLRPHRYDMRSRSKKYAPLSFEEILDFFESAGAIMDRIIALLEEMVPTAIPPSSPEKSAEPHSDPPPAEGSR